eukprot:299322-Pelagomonas_calceolata.AAC.1
MVWGFQAFLLGDDLKKVLFVSDLLNPRLSRLERAESAVGKRRLVLLSCDSNSCKRWSRMGQLVFNPSGSHDGSQKTS